MKNLEKIALLCGKILSLSADGNDDALAGALSELTALVQQSANIKVLPLQSTDNNFTGFLKFTEKEISDMPKKFRQTFRIDGCAARVYRRKCGKHTYNYEIRYRKDGYDVYACANNLDIAKGKFIEKLKVADKEGPKVHSSAPTTFTAFALFFIENFWKRKVTETTYKNEMYRFNNHLKPYFAEKPLRKITPLDCQALLDKFTEKGQTKTANEIYSALNKIFVAAIKHGIITRNPLDLVFKEKHYCTHGKALSKEEERALLTHTSGTRYGLLFAVVLYTGLRPNEYRTARIEGNFIVAKNSKQKDGKEHFKKIPITPMLAPYLSGVDVLNFTDLKYMAERLHEVLPEHKLYDLRTTFYTRCQECGVAEVALKTFVGHSLGGLADTYTDLSDEYLLREGSKLKY